MQMLVRVPGVISIAGVRVAVCIGNIIIGKLSGDSRSWR